MTGGDGKTGTGRRAVGRLWAMASLLLALGLGSFVLGRYDVPLVQVVRILWNGTAGRIAPGLALEQTWTDSMAVAVLNVRLPRILLASLVGCCLAAAGTGFQSVFQNPMAAPDILGASAGACFGAALSILLGLGRAWTVAGAFLFSLVTVALVYLVGSRTRGSRAVNLILAGVMVSSLFSAGTSYIKLVADPANQLPAITYWLMGSLSGARMSDVRFAAIPAVLGLAPMLLLRWRINMLSLEEDEARTMGVNVGRLRFAVVLCATFLTAGSVAVSGMIGWVGLVVPHLCRKLVGSDSRYLLPGSMLFGAAFLLLVDNASRNLLATEIPIGILTAFVGAPFFLLLMTGKEASL